MSGRVKVYAPASIGNVGCGFDVLGLCLEAPGDELEAWITDEPGVRINAITGDEGKLSRNAAENTAGIAIQSFLEATGEEKGVTFDLHKKMPFGSGLGSSAASAVAGAFAANELFGRPLTKNELVVHALAGEKYASKSAHADNVAPSLMGGFVLARGEEPFDIVKVPAASELRVVLIYPHVEINTSEARRIIPSEVPLKKAITQWGNVAGLVAGMMQNDFDLIGRSLTDVIVEPYRSKLIPGFDEMRKAAMESGALGFSISGSGPTCFALTNNEHLAQAIGDAMSTVMKNKGIGFTTYQSRVNEAGPKILSV
ncbi:MAG: homoserine kinase [Cyclobacteriaceae bacterium]